MFLESESGGRRPSSHFPAMGSRNRALGCLAPLPISTTVWTGTLLPLAFGSCLQKPRGRGPSTGSVAQWLLSGGRALCASVAAAAGRSTERGPIIRMGAQLREGVCRWGHLGTPQRPHPPSAPEVLGGTCCAGLLPGLCVLREDVTGAAGTEGKGWSRGHCWL